MAGEKNIGQQSGYPQGYIGDTRGQQFISSDPNVWINKLLKANPALKSDPYLVTSLTQQFKNSTDPAKLAHSVGMAKYMSTTADHVGLSSLYPTPNTIYDAPAYKAPDKWWQATNDTGNWFKKLVQPVGNVLGSAMGGFIGAVSTPEAGKTVGDFFRAGIPSAVGTLASSVSKLAVGTGRLATGNINDLTAGQGLAPAWRWQDPLYLGEAIKEGLSSVSQIPWMADTYMTNLKSQVNKKGLGTALGEQTGNFIGGAAIGGWIGKAAEGESTISAIVRAAELANVQDAKVIESLTAKLKTSGSITAEEQAALEKAKQDLTSRNKNALHENAYTSGVNEFKQQFPLEHGILEQDLARGAITQKEFDQAIAKGIAGEAQPAFTSASEAINGEQATARAAQDAIQAQTLSMSQKLYQSVAGAPFYAIAGPLKGIATMSRLLGSKSANITYVLGALQAQQNPEDAYIWQLAEQGKVLNADGTTQDLGIEIANSLGIDGMWGTAVRDLVDVGLKWVVDDPIASFFRTVKEARSAYGMTGALGKWFHGTGITHVGDVFRAYMEYSSVRRAVRWMATHSAGQINERFGALFLSNTLLEKLGAAKSDAAILSILEEASQSLIMAERVTSMPSMGWYTYAKTALRGETSEKFATLGDALASPTMPTDKIIEAIRKETGSDITARDAEFASGGVALKANILLGQRLRRQFAMRQMINEAGRVTDRLLIVGSPRSVKGIGELLKSNYMSDDFIKEVTDQLIRHGNDHQVWNNIYNNAMRISIYRRMLAAGAHADFALFIDNMGHHIDDYIYGHSGVDGGGIASGQAMVADANELADKSMHPETGKVSVSAVDTPQLGQRFMPSEREFRQLSRFTTRISQHVTNEGADIFLRSTNKTFEVVRQLAEAAGVKAETYIKNFKFEDRAQAFSPITREKITEKIPNEIPPAEFYHGSSTGIEGGVLGDALTEGRAANNLFGPGFYTTDNAEIARSYTGKGAKRAEKAGKLNKTVHGIRWTGENPPNFVDLEQVAPKEFRESFNQFLDIENWPGNEDITQESLNEFKKILDDPNAFGSKIYFEFKELLADAHVYLNDADEILQNVAYNLQEKGIDGLRYQGGAYAAKSKGTLHEVRIFFDSNKLSIESTTAAERTAERYAYTVDPAYKGYVAKSREVIDRATQMLEGDELKGMTSAERYASVVKYLDAQLSHIREIYTFTSKKYEHVQMTQFDPNAIEKAFGTNVNVEEMLNHLHGELKAVEHLSAEMKSAISSTASSSDNLKKQAAYLASTASDKEAGELYKEAFMKKWQEDFDKPAGRRVGISQTYEFIHNITGFEFKSLGKYEMRNTMDVAVDFSQGYLNGWFKPLTLSTPAWADRVTISEILLNALRIGGHAFTEAKLVQSIAKNELYLGKVRVGDLERKAIRFAITNMILGMDKALARTLKGKEYDDFLDFATNLYLETDGHMLGAIHAQGDLMSEDGFKTHMANQVVGVGKNGEIKTSNKILGPNFRKYGTNDIHHGAAMYEAITRVHHGVINKEVARFYQAKIEAEGQRIFDSNPTFYMEQARKDAYAELEKLNIKPTDKSMKSQLKTSLDKKIRDIGAESLSTEASMARLRSEANVHMESFIDALPANVRSSFKRDTDISMKYPNDSAHRGWAKTAVDHVQGIGTDANYIATGANATTIFPDLIHQMATGEFQTQREMAEWLQKRYATNEPVPTAIPAHEYISMFSAGNLNPARKFSEWMHRGILGKIVNTGSRDPLFVYEAWQQFKKVKPLVDAGYKDIGEAMRFAQTEALVNMTKYVHNPLDKTIWEENMRVLAPYYFAKNQAIRRALRMGGDNFAAFEKYIKINTAVTDYVALAYDQSGIGSFTFPGSTIIMAIPNGIANSYYGALKNMGLESSPASPDSIIITGSHPGIGGMIENLIHIPVGPIVTIPAKYVYEQLAHRVPYIGEAITWLLGDVSMRSSIWSDLFPNSTVKNIKNGIYGHMNQQQASSYLSAENHVITQQITNMYVQFRNEAIDEMKKQGIINKQNINSGSMQQLITQFAMTNLNNFLKDPRNRADLQDAANWATTALYASKTFSTFFTPLSAVIAADTKVQEHLSAIALEKGSDGEYKYPNRTLQVAELIRRFPEELFEVSANSKSPFSVWNQNLGSLQYATKHYNMVMEHPYITAYLPEQEGEKGKYAPGASQLYGTMGLRKLQVPEEHITSLRVGIGNTMFYQVMQPQFQALYPGDYYFQDPSDPSTGMSKQGYNAWQAAGKAYANNDNAVWGAHQYGGEKKNTAVATYKDLNAFMSNKDYVKTLTPAQKEIIPILINERKIWEQKYKDAAGEKYLQSELKTQWYETMTNFSTLPSFSPVSNMITSVFLKLPPPK